MEEKLAILTSVAAVCREIGGLGGVEFIVTDFLDASVLWTLPSACEKCPDGVVRLLERIAAREDPDMDPLLKRWHFTLCLEKAIKKGNLEVVKWIVEEYLPEGRVRKPVLTAVKYSRLEILQWLYTNHQERVVWDSSMRMQDTLETRVNLETLKWVHENIVPIDYQTKKKLMKNTVSWKLVDRVDWLHSLDLPIVQPDLNVAIRFGMITTVEWIRDHTNAQFTEELLGAAVRSGRISMVQWFYNNYGFLTVFADEVSTGIAEIISRVESGGTQIVDEFITWVLEHLMLTNKEGLARAIDVLARCDSLEAIKAIHKISGNGLCTTLAMDRTAINGRLDLVKWLHTNRSEGCTPAAMDGAAANGHLEIVKFLHEHRNEGCTTAAMDGAAENGHHAIVKWLHKNRHEGCTTYAMDLAAGYGHLAIVEFLHENRTEGCTTNAMNWAAQNGHLKVVKWLHENRSEGCTFEAMNKAAAKGHLQMVKWLYENRSEGCADTALHNALQNRRYDIIRWLYRRIIKEDPQLQVSNDTELKYQIELKFHGGIMTMFQAERELQWAIDKSSKEYVCWLLNQLPEYRFSSDVMLYAVMLSKLDIAMMLAKDGRFPCDIRCINHACDFERVEIFQWLMRDFSYSIPNAREYVEQVTRCNAFMRDALNELEQLTVSI